MAQSHQPKPPKASPARPGRHAQALVAHLKTVEDFCGEVERLVEARDHIFSEYSGVISESEKLKIGAILEKVYENLEELRDRLDLHKQPIDRFNAINAYLSELWVSLVETKSHHLKAYGQVPEDLAAILDPRLDALDAQIHQLMEIVQTLKAQRVSKSMDDPRGRAR